MNSREIAAQAIAKGKLQHALMMAGERNYHAACTSAADALMVLQTLKRDADAAEVAAAAVTTGERPVPTIVIPAPRAAVPLAEATTIRQRVSQWFMRKLCQP